MPDAPTPQEIEALLARVPEGCTPGPWQWWTSNSWRRLKRDAPGITTPVAEPFVASDGHPDLCISREDMALVALAPDLALALRALAEERERLAAENARLSGGWVLKRAVKAEAERDRLRDALTELRPLIEDQRDDLLRDFTTIGSGNDRATMDSQEAEIVAEWDAGLALIDAALAEPPHA